MNRFRMLKAVIGLSAILIAFPVVADSNLADTFKQLDVNGDGVISSGEMARNSDLLEQWSKLDQNSDGLVEMSEFSAFEESRAAESSNDDFDQNISD